jgi:hypothetical protein
MRTIPVSLSLAVVIVGCGGRQILLQPDEAADAGVPVTATAAIGPVDLTQAPAEIATTCDHGVGTITFVNPCLVGHNLGGGSDVGFHVVECSLTTSQDPHAWAWSFMLPLVEVAKTPDRPLMFPGDLPPLPASNDPEVVGGRAAHLSSVTGAVTFSRVDPTARAFIGRLKATMTWKDDSSGATFSCDADAPFWGAPGGFL